MPIETILPDATTTPNPAWVGVPHVQLSNQGSNFTSCAGVNTGESFIVSFNDLTSDIGSINSIRFYTAGIVSVTRGVDAVCSFDLLNSSDSSYSYAESKTFNDTTLSTLQAGTERTTSDGSTAWTESDVKDLRMQVTFTSIANTAGQMDLDFLKIDVDYNEPPALTYDTTIGRIRMNSGTIILDGGTIILD